MIRRWRERCIRGSRSRCLARAASPGAGAAALILAFSPNLVTLSPQMRGYTLALALAAGALLCLERAIEERSGRWLALFTGRLQLAILSEHSAAYFAAAAGVYMLARAAADKLPRRFLVVWAAGQWVMSELPRAWRGPRSAAAPWLLH